MSDQTRTCATTRRPECQQARVPLDPTFPCLFSQAAGVMFQLAREGRRACLSVVCSLLLFSLLSFFRAGFPGVFWKQVCAVATSAIRGVSRSGCAASPCSSKVPPDSRGQWHQELRAPTQEPRILQVSPSVFGTQLGIAVLGDLWDVLGLRFLAPARRNFGK